MLHSRPLGWKFVRFPGRWSVSSRRARWLQGPRRWWWRPATGRVDSDRRRLVRQALVLSAVSVALGAIFAIVAVAQAISHGSVALLAFGTDAAIDAAASVALLWRFSIERRDPGRARDA